jgi:undecaprenyl phosphate-alpha-L-ara4N flippase subunit ArnE
MATKLWAIGIVLFCTFLVSIAQIFYKFGVDNLSNWDVISIITNVNLWIGLILYIIGGFLLVLGLRGGELSVLYPIIATGYIWVSFLSIYFLNESMNLFKWLGVFTIVGGIALIGFGSKKTTVKEVGII